MSSDYDISSTLSANQIMKERDRKDRRIVEIERLKSKTNLSVADYMRDEILHGTTAHLRRFKKRGNDYGWQGFYRFDKLTGVDTTIKQYLINDGAREAGDIKTFSRSQWTVVSAQLQSLATLSQDAHNLTAEDHVFNGETYIGYITHAGDRQHVSEYKTDPATKNLIIVASKWNPAETITEIDTGLPSGSQPTVDREGYIGTYNTNANPDTEYGFFSVANKYKAAFEGTENYAEFMPFVALKDGGNNEEPYYTLPHTDIEYKRRKKILKILNIDFDDLSEAILNPPNIPAITSHKWKSKYRPTWEDSQQLQADYPTEQDYYNHVVDLNQDQKDNSDQVSDAHVVIAATPLFMNETSAYAALHTMRPILEQYDGDGKITLAGGSQKQTWDFKGVRIVRRQGIVRNMYDTGGSVRNKKRKASWYIKSYDKDNNFVEDGYGGDETDPILNTYKNVGTLTSAAGDDPADRCIFELRAQDHIVGGNRTYVEIRILGFKSESIVTQLHNPDYPNGPIRTTASADLCNIENEKYVNGILIPLTWTSIKDVGVFERDRLIREVLILSIQGVAVKEIPWYRTGVFKILIIVVVVVTTIVFAPAGQAAAYLMNMAESMAIGMVANVLNQIIDNPLFAALLTLAVGLISSGFMLDFAGTISLAVEATGTYINKVMAQEAIAMQKKLDEQERISNESYKQLKKLEEEFGLNKADNNAFMLYLASLPPSENPVDFFGRALNRDLCEINLKKQITPPQL